MRHKFFYLIFLLSPVLASAQVSRAADSANKLILNGKDCDDRTFTRVEVPPSLKVSNEDYADTLSTYLKAHKAFSGNDLVEFRFIVTCHGEIRSLTCYTADVVKKADIEKAILLYSGLWVPATQNGYIVNSYVRLALQFDKNALTIKISQ